MPFSLTNLTWVNNCDAQPGKMSSNITLLNNMLDYMDTSVNKTVYLYQTLEPSYGDWATAYYQKHQTTVIPNTADLYWINSSGFAGWYRYVQNELVVMDSPYSPGKQQTVNFAITSFGFSGGMVVGSLTQTNSIPFKTYRPSRLSVNLTGYTYGDSITPAPMSIKLLLYDGVSIYYNLITGVNVGNVAFAHTASNPNLLVGGPVAATVSPLLVNPFSTFAYSNWSVPAKLTWSLGIYAVYNTNLPPAGAGLYPLSNLLRDKRVLTSSMEIYYE